MPLIKNLADMVTMTPVNSIAFGAYSACICIDGKPVPVYKVEANASARTTTCYIESIPHAQFTIQTSATRSGYPLPLAVTRISLDGTCESVEWAQPGDRSSSNGRMAGNLLQPFMFCPLSMTDDDELATTDESFVKNLGSIALHIHEVELQGAPKPTKIWSANDTVESSKTIHEASKKATMSEQTKLGEPVKVENAPTSYQSVNYLDPIEAPFGKLVFYYRSRALLEMMDIKDLVPLPQAEQAAASSSRSPSPAPVAKKEKKPVVAKKRTSDTVTTISDDEEDVKPRFPKKRKSDQPPEVIVIDDD